MTAVRGLRQVRVLAEVARRGSVFIILLALMLIFSALTDRFLTVSNLTNVLIQTAPVVIVTVGMTLTMLMAGIDLSVGSVAAVTGALAAGLVVREGLPVLLAMAVALIVGGALGWANGALVVFGRLPPFVATLAMMGVARGLALAYTEGKPIAIREYEDFTYWREGMIGPLPVPIVMALVVLASALIALRLTRFGLHIYAIGGNEETTRLAGVPTNRIKLIVYTLSGVTAALTGLQLTARLYSAQPRTGVGLELDAIAAAVLGGVSLFGGVGGVVGATVGALIIGVLGNGLNLLRVPSYNQQVFQGILLVVAVVVDLHTKRRRER
jgi:ribose transport system permease protein